MERLDAAIENCEQGNVGRAIPSPYPYLYYFIHLEFTHLNANGSDNGNPQT